MSKIRNGSLLYEAANFIYPKKCISCGVYIREDRFLCTECESHVMRTKAPFCQFCGIGKEYCKCKRVRRAYENVIAPFYYEGSIKNAMGRLKFGKKEGISRFFGEEISKDIEAKYFGVIFDVVAPVPATNRSISERGFNQSVSILESIDMPEEIKDYTLLSKHKQESIQHLLGAEKRRENVNNAYYVSEGKNVRGKTILLVDDILTTGSTANACASILRFNGAERVFVAVAALDIMHND